MFNSTHTLTGLVLVKAGVGRGVPKAAWIAAIAANFPDVDIVAQIAGTGAYLQYHRGITHTLVGLPVQSLVLAVLAWVYLRQRPGPVRTTFSGIFMLVLVSMATHPALDYLNTYGVRPFLPFSTTWYYGDSVFIFDPVADALLGAGLVFGWWPRFARHAAVAALVLVTAYVGFRSEMRNQAMDQLASHTRALPEVLRLAVIPHVVNPIQWTGLVQTTDETFSVRLDIVGGAGPRIAGFDHAPETEAVRVASMTRSARIMEDFARFPVTRTEATPSGIRVVFLDFRFYRLGSGTAFAAEVELDRNLTVLRETVRLNSPIP